MDDLRYNVNAHWDATSKDQYAWGWGSHHTGGAHFLMGDGAVRFISENINYTTFFLANRIMSGVPHGEL